MARRNTNQTALSEEEIPAALRSASDEAPTPASGRTVFAADFVRIRHLGVLGEAFVSELRGRALGEKQKPSKLGLDEWDSMYLEWSRKPRG